MRTLEAEADFFFKEILVKRHEWYAQNTGGSFRHARKAFKCNRAFYLRGHPVECGREIAQGEEYFDTNAPKYSSGPRAIDPMYKHIKKRICLECANAALQETAALDSSTR